MQPENFASFSLSPAAKNLLDTPPQLVFDQFTRLTAKIFGVPVSLISVIDKDRQFFKSSLGLPETLGQITETPLAHSFCRHVVSNGAVLAIADSRESGTLQDDSSISDLGVVAYAGAPIRDGDGIPFAALCAIDSQPRRWSAGDLEILEMLAAQVTREIILREHLEIMGLNGSLMQATHEAREGIGRADRHDLRTPLGALLLSIEAVRETGPVNPDQGEFLRIAESSVETIIGMVDSLVDIGSVDSRGATALTRKVVRLDKLVDAARAQVVPLAREKKLSLHATSDEIQIFVDGSKLIRVFVNLLANSIKFTPQGGTVRIQANLAQGAAKKELHITVSDTGIGISPTHIGHIFQEGYRVDENARTRRSSGLGLTFCKRIVEVHGGSIGVTSEFGRGSVFTIILPCEPENLQGESRLVAE